MNSIFNKLQNHFVLIGRILLAYFFIPAGISKISGFSGTVGYISSQGLFMPEVSAVMAILAEVGAGTLLLVGFQTRLAALVLAFFTLMASIFFHAYWSVPEGQAMMQQLLFNKNIAVVGGLLFLAAFGAGSFSIDNKFNARA